MKAEEKLLLIGSLLHDYYDCVKKEEGYKDGIIDAIFNITCFDRAVIRFEEEVLTQNK